MAATNWLDSYGMSPERYRKLGDVLGGSPRAGASDVGPVNTPPPNPAGSLTLSPGFTPDYRGLILSDPAYTSWKNDAQLSMGEAAAQRRAALKALAIRYGDLGPAKDVYGDLDAATLQAAKANLYSDTAQLERAYGQGVENLKSNLAARGMLQSSDLGAGLSQADFQHGASEYDLGQQFANAFQSAVNDYLGAEAAARQREVGAVQAATSNVMSNPLNQPAPAVSANLDPDWQAKYGSPVYVGPDGSLYNADGTPYNSTVTAPPAGGSTDTGSTPPPTRGDSWTEGVNPADYGLGWTGSYDPALIAAALLSGYGA